MWTANRNADGYGLASHHGRRVLAHRLAWFLARGRWPDPCALHKCDGGAGGCVRVSHLFEGDRADNIADAVAKGRQSYGVSFGEKSGNAKLRDADIPRIRKALRAGQSNRRIAERFGVTPGTIWFIATGKTHKLSPSD